MTSVAVGENLCFAVGRFAVKINQSVKVHPGASISA